MGHASHALLLALPHRLEQLIPRRLAHHRVLLLDAPLLLRNLPVALVRGLHGGAVEARARCTIPLRLAVQRARALLKDPPVLLLRPLLHLLLAVVFLRPSEPRVHVRGQQNRRL